MTGGATVGAFFEITAAENGGTNKRLLARFDVDHAKDLMSAVDISIKNKYINVFVKCRTIYRFDEFVTINNVHIRTTVYAAR